MVLHKIFKNLVVLGSICWLMGCAQAVFPEMIEDNDEIFIASATSGKGKILKAGSSLGSDKANAAYEGDPNDEEDVFADVIPAEKKAKAPQKHISEVKKVETPKPEKKESGKAAPAPLKPIVEETAMVVEEKIAEDKEPSVTYRLETIYFANGSSVVENGHAAKFREAAKLAKSKNAKIKVLGYASSRTRNTDIVTHKMANFKVSNERAENVAKALRQYGVPAESISVEALSDSDPAYMEVMPEGERLNRRAEIYISY